MMANSEKEPVTIEGLLVCSLTQADALAKLLIEKGVITDAEFKAPNWVRHEARQLQ
jgi:hypothetical protein